MQHIDGKLKRYVLQITMGGIFARVLLVLITYTAESETLSLHAPTYTKAVSVSTQSLNGNVLFIINAFS